LQIIIPFDTRLSAVYQETGTIWFSDFYDEEEEAMFKLIGVSVDY
jgi:hypothetical protein